MSHDVVVVGAGIVGCATAAFLAQGGARVAVFEAGDGIGAGASGRNAGLVEHPFDGEQAGLYEETVALLREVLGEDVVPGAPSGALLLFDDERDASDAAGAASAVPSLAPRLLDPDALVAAEPAVRPGLWGVHLATGHPLRPAAAVEAFAARARESGATIATGAPVALRRDGAGDGMVRGVVTRDGEEHRADAVVVAAGAGASALVDPNGAWRPVRPLWGVSVTVGSSRAPQLPIFDGRAEGTLPSAFTLVPTPAELALGSTWLDDEPDPAAWAPRLLAGAAAFWPAAAEATIEGVRACARPRSFDARPLLGRAAGGDPGLWLATGHGGRGISTGAASARLVADALLAGDDAAIPGPLRADRFAAPPAPGRTAP